MFYLRLMRRTWGRNSIEVTSPCDSVFVTELCGLQQNRNGRPLNLYLIIVHGDIEFIVKFKSHAPYDSPEPQTVVGVHWLCLCGNVQDVLALVQGTHILTYTNRDFGHFIYCLFMPRVVAD